jgi:hypothetical protein
MSVRELSLVAALLAAVCFTTAASAALLNGTSVTGDLNFGGTLTTNWFDPANGHVPAGPLNNAGTTVTIGAAVEFGYHDGANNITADFTDTTLTVTITSSLSGVDPTKFTFTDTAFAGLSITEPTDTFPGAGGLSESLVGDVLTLNYAGDGVNATKTAVFDFAAANGGGGGGVPLPLAAFAAIPALTLAGRMARRL